MSLAPEVRVPASQLPMGVGLPLFLYAQDSAFNAFRRYSLANLAALFGAVGITGPAYELRDELFADLNWPANAVGFVGGEANPALNGLYRKDGAAHLGGWTRIGPLTPDLAAFYNILQDAIDNFDADATEIARAAAVAAQLAAELARDEAEAIVAGITGDISPLAALLVDEPFAITAGPWERSLRQYLGDFEENLANWKTIASPTDWAPIFKQAAAAANTRGVPLRVPSATYNFSTQEFLPDDCVLNIVGERGSKFTCTADVSPIRTDTALGKFAVRVSIKDVEIDGGGLASTVVRLEANPNATEGTWFKMEGCYIHHTTSLPILIQNFERARVFKCNFFRTKDPGFTFCQTVWFYENSNILGLDNGVSCSRGCRRVFIHDNLFEDNFTNSAVVAGFTTAGPGTAKVSGASYVAGATITVDLVGSTDFRAYVMRQRITLVSGVDECEVLLTVFTTTTQATGVLMQNCPASLQNVATATWYYANQGNSEIHFHNNTCVGGRVNGLKLRNGPRLGKIADNLFIRTGMCVDRDVESVGTIIAGSFTLTTTTVMALLNTNYIILKGTTSQWDYFIAQVTAGAGTLVLTLAQAPPDTYIGSPVFKLAAPNVTTSAAIEITSGGTGIDRKAALLSLTDNHIHDCLRYGVQLVNSDAVIADIGVGFRNVSINGLMWTYSAAGAPSTLAIADRAVVLIEEASVGQQLNGVSLNGIEMFDSDSGSNSILRFSQRGASARATLMLGRMVASDPAIQPVRAFDADNALADVSSVYHFQHTASRNRIEFDQIDVHHPAAPTAAAAIAITKFLNQVTPGSNTSVTDLTRESGAAMPLFIIENASASFTLTLTHAAAKIRCPGATNYVIGVRSAVFAYFTGNGDIVQVVGPVV